MKPLLVTILVVAGGGVAFSGYRSYRELFAATPVNECTPLSESGSALRAPPSHLPTFSVRQRSSIVASRALMPSTRAAIRYRELHARLEALLARSARIALVSFNVVDRVGTTDPRLATHAVTAYMVRSARRMGDLLRCDWPDEPIPELLLATLKQRTTPGRTCTSSIRLSPAPTAGSSN